MTPPFIFFFDVDGTLVGDVSPLICMWELCKRFAPSHMYHVRREVIYNLKSGLLRPYTAQLIQNLKHEHKTSEVFVFTAADKKWAEFLISCIEQVINFKFNRPMFTRQNCLRSDNEIRKSIKHILPTAVKTIKKNNVACQGMLTHHFQEHMVLIDNSPVLVDSEMKKWIKCPTYHFRNTIDVLKYFSDELLKNNSEEVIKLLHTYDMFPKNVITCTYDQFRILYYQHLSKHIAYDYSHRKTKKITSDTFFIQLSKVLSSDLPDLRKRTVTHINNSIRT